MSTEDKKVYLMDVREVTAESHTAVWIKSYILEACLSVILSIDANYITQQIIDLVGRSQM